MILTLTNFLFYNLIFFVLYKLKKIQLNLLIFFIFFLSSVFFINGFLMEPGYMPDQDAYLLLMTSIRKLNFYFLEEFHLNLSDRTFIASGFMTLVPAIFINSITDIALSQKFLYLITLLYLYKKKTLNNYSFAVLFFLPSIILYTGLALKESLLFSLVSLGFYFSVKKKFFFSICCYVILAIIKPLVFAMCISFNLFYLIFFHYKIYFNLKIVLFILIAIIGFLAVLLNIEIINSELNQRRLIESIYDRKLEAPIAVNLTDIKSLSSLFVFSFGNFLFNPNIISSSNLFQFIQSLENLFVLVLLCFNFAFCYRLNKFKAVFWTSFFLIGMFVIGSTVFNAGTLSRWKIEILSYYIFYINYTCSKLKI